MPSNTAVSCAEGAEASGGLVWAVAWETPSPPVNLFIALQA